MVRRNFDREFREGAVRIVRETGRPIAQVVRELAQRVEHAIPHVVSSRALGVSPALFFK